MKESVREVEARPSTDEKFHQDNSFERDEGAVLSPAAVAEEATEAQKKEMRERFRERFGSYLLDICRQHLERKREEAAKRAQGKAQ